MAVTESDTAPSDAPARGNDAIGDLLRQRKRALRAVQANTKLRARADEKLSSWSPNAALYKKRRALRHDLASSSAAERRPAEEPSDVGKTSDRKEESARPRSKWFAGLLDSPNTQADSADNERSATEQPSDSPQARKTVHGVLQSPGEVRLSDAAKKARRQLTRISKLTRDNFFGDDLDEPVFCSSQRGGAAADGAIRSRADLFSADLGAGDGAIMCADLAIVHSAQSNAVVQEEVETKTEQQIAADVAARACQSLFSGAINSAMARLGDEGSG